jgi:SNF family Na+-dependent transporter
MSEPSPATRNAKEHWASRMGVVLAVAGSAVGLGNFLRFPGQAVNNGGGAFMLPYIISFLLLGIPICWCEWTMGRLGGRYGQSSGPGIYYALWRHPLAKLLGAFTLMIPIVIYMYYVFIEAWCLHYCLSFASGKFAELYQTAATGASGDSEVRSAIVGGVAARFAKVCGLEEHGQTYFAGNMIWLVGVCFVINFVIIYRGVTRGIETFCKIAMPLLIGCAVIILIRVLTLDGIGAGLGFMWNPQWHMLKEPKVWLAASGQIFFSLSIGFGLILTYSSYLRRDDDVALSALSASSMNEFCEVVLGGMIVVPTAFLFLGAENATGSTFGLGFNTIPAIMHYMPGGSFFGAMWFGLLFLAAVTSSLSMLQPAIAFLEEGFGLRRRSSVAILGLITCLGAAPIIYYNRGAVALDHTDFWAGNFLMFVAATGMVLVFGWVIGAEKGLREANRGAELRIPPFIAFLIRYVSPTFLLIVFTLWLYGEGPNRIKAMSPDRMGAEAARTVYESAITEHFADEDPENQVAELIGKKGLPDLATLPAWLRESSDVKAAEKRTRAESDARIARNVFILLALFLIALLVLSDLACRRRIKATIEYAEAEDPELRAGVQ